MAEEANVEKYLKKQIEAIGGLCWKWVSPGRSGVPDRICIMPGGLIFFVELKAPGKVERPEQKLVQHYLRKRGCVVYSSISTKHSVDSVVTWAKLEMIRREAMKDASTST